MKIAVASGKGGTGKTTVATNLARAAADAGRRVAYLDCDVEEPNGHIFLKPTLDAQRDIEKPVPVVDMTRCTHCGKCAKVCRYGAVACLPQRTLVFTDLCHSCGGCALVCPSDAIREEPLAIGVLRSGTSGAIRFVDGVLNVGQAMSTPAIRAVKTAAPDAELTILDAPPGTSCPVVETVRDCDLVVLVTEPTPFGLHDLALAVKMVRAVRRPLAVVLNRAGLGGADGSGECARHGAPLLAEIPDDRAVAEAYSRGEMITDAVPGYAARMRELLARIEQRGKR